MRLWRAGIDYDRAVPASPTADTYNAFVIAESQMEIIKWEFKKNENRRW